LLAWSPEPLTDLVRESADHRPDRVVKVLGAEREIEPDELVVLLDQLKRFRP
jgi:hypothetical protein